MRRTVALASLSMSGRGQRGRNTTIALRTPAAPRRYVRPYAPRGVLNRMSEKQAIEVGIPPHDRAAYIRIDRAKGNYSRIGGETRWLTFDNVDLPQGDSVGVLKLWLMPGAEGA